MGKAAPTHRVPILHVGKPYMFETTELRLVVRISIG